MRIHTFLLLLCILACISISVSGRGIWGAKRGKKEKENEEEQEVEVANTGGIPNFEATRKRFEVNKEISGIKLPSKDQISIAINAYIDAMEKMMDEPQFASMVTPDAIRSILSNVPSLSSNEELIAILDSDQFSDPANLRQLMSQGMVQLRQFSGELANMLSDPAQMEALLDQLPAEVRAPLNSVLSGDMSQLKGILSNIPGLDPSQRKVLSAIIDGVSNPESKMDALNAILGDPEQVENARLQMLENPIMAEMLGVPVDILHDKKQFAELIAKGAEQLGNDAPEQKGGRTFASSMVA